MAPPRERTRRAYPIVGLVAVYGRGVVPTPLFLCSGASSPLAKRAPNRPRPPPLGGKPPSAFYRSCSVRCGAATRSPRVFRLRLPCRVSLGGAPLPRLVCGAAVSAGRRSPLRSPPSAVFPAASPLVALGLAQVNRSSSLPVAGLWQFGGVVIQWGLPWLRAFRHVGLVWACAQTKPLCREQPMHEPN